MTAKTMEQEFDDARREFEEEHGDKSGLYLLVNLLLFITLLCLAIGGMVVLVNLFVAALGGGTFMAIAGFFLKVIGFFACWTGAGILTNVVCDAAWFVKNKVVGLFSKGD